MTCLPSGTSNYCWSTPGPRSEQDLDFLQCTRPIFPVSVLMKERKIIHINESVNVWSRLTIVCHRSAYRTFTYIANSHWVMKPDHCISECHGRNEFYISRLRWFAVLQLALTVARIAVEMASPMASGAEPLMSLRFESQTPKTTRTSVKVEKNSTPKPWVGDSFGWICVTPNVLWNSAGVKAYTQ